MDLRKEEEPFLGSYAATNPTEFFSVASEKFFCLPAQLRQHHPELFEVLAEYYRVDPLRWFEVEATAQTDSPQAAPSSAAVDTAVESVQAHSRSLPPRPANEIGPEEDVNLRFRSI